MTKIKVNLKAALNFKSNYGKDASNAGFKFEKILADILNGKKPKGVTPTQAKDILTAICAEFNISPTDILKAEYKQEKLTKNGQKDPRTKTDILVTFKNSSKKISITAKCATGKYVGVVETSIESFVKNIDATNAVANALRSYRKKEYKIKNLKDYHKKNLRGFFKSSKHRKKVAKFLIVGNNNNEIQRPTHTIFYNKLSNEMMICTVDEYINLVEDFISSSGGNVGSFNSGLNFTRTSSKGDKNQVHLKIKELNPTYRSFGKMITY